MYLLPPLDPSWQPVLIFIGTLAGVVFTYFGIRTTGRANTKMKEIDAASEIIQEYRTMKDDIKTDADQRETRMKAAFAEAIEKERQERLTFEDRMTQQLNEVIDNFGIYVRWARDGAVPPPPFIPEWIYSKIVDVFKKSE